MFCFLFIYFSSLFAARLVENKMFTLERKWPSQGGGVKGGISLESLHSQKRASKVRLPLNAIDPYLVKIT